MLILLLVLANLDGPEKIAQRLLASMIVLDMVNVEAECVSARVLTAGMIVH
jgi:hypothetical protein